MLAYRSVATQGRIAMRWMWTALTVFGFVAAWFAQTPGLLAILLLTGFVSMFCAVFSFAAARIASQARPDVMIISPEELAQMRRRAEAARKSTPPSLPSKS